MGKKRNADIGELTVDASLLCLFLNSRLSVIVARYCTAVGSRLHPHFMWKGHYQPKRRPITLKLAVMKRESNSICMLLCVLKKSSRKSFAFPVFPMQDSFYHHALLDFYNFYL